jgi:hypothetical protein
LQIFLQVPSSLIDRPWIAIACYLVEHGAPLDQPDARGNTPISYVKTPAVIEILLKYARFVSLFESYSWEFTV